jgi:molybdopterin molybdotransferase
MVEQRYALSRPLLTVSQALERVLAMARRTPVESVALGEAAGRVLAQDVAARRTQPPFPASAMDGYAVRADDLDGLRALRVIGESAAGHGYSGAVGPGEAVRIFTGAPVPDGADTILIQENAQATDGPAIVPKQTEQRGRFVRPAGLDFTAGEIVLRAGRVLDPSALSLAAAANHPVLPCHRRPRVAILATGDELVSPGTEPGDHQIIASNHFGVAAACRAVGAETIDLGIAADTQEALDAALDRAIAHGADVLVTLGGASVGDHDLVQSSFRDRGMALDFWKIAMRPGKPLMAGMLDKMLVLGLPGNPVSSLVCSELFVKPLVAAMQGGHWRPDLRRTILAEALPENDSREDYLRASLSLDNGKLTARAFARQDSSMLLTLANANGLIIRAPHCPPATAGDEVDVLVLRREAME